MFFLHYILIVVCTWYFAFDLCHCVYCPPLNQTLICVSAKLLEYDFWVLFYTLCLVRKCAITYFSCASSFAVGNLVLEIFLKDVTDVQRSVAFVQSRDGVLDGQHKLLIHAHRQLELRSSYQSYKKRTKLVDLIHNLRYYSSMRAENMRSKTHCHHKGGRALICCMEAPRGQYSSRAWALRAPQLNKPHLRPNHWSDRTRSLCF